MTRLQITLLGIMPALALLAIDFGAPQRVVGCIGLILILLTVHGVFDKRKGSVK